MSSQITKQGVKNLNSMGQKPPKVNRCPPHTPSKWKEEIVFPFSQFEDWDSYKKRERKRCLYCGELVDDRPLA